MFDPLFSGISIVQAIEDQRGRAEAAIAALQRSDLLERGLDDLEAELVEFYRFDPIVLRWDDRTPESRDAYPDLDSDVEREISDRTRRVRVKGTEITLKVPFSGTPELLHMQPSADTDDAPRGFVTVEKNLLLRYSYVDAEPAVVQRELDRQAAAVNERVSAINKDIGPFNAGLPELIRTGIKARLDKLQADADVVAALGVPQRQHHTSSRGDIKSEPGHVDAQPPPPPTDQASGHRTRQRTRPRGTRYLTRPMVFRARRDLEVDAAAGKLRMSDGRIRPYITMQDLANKLSAPLGTLRDFLRDEHLSWLDRALWPPQ